MSDCEFEEEPLDPRIQHELEKLNKASLLINKLENDLDNARGQFRQLLSESTASLDALAKRLGGSIERAKPYYDARLKAKEVQALTHAAAIRYERAVSMQNAAREMVDLAVQGYENKSRKHKFDTAWQETLNHATIKCVKDDDRSIFPRIQYRQQLNDVCENLAAIQTFLTKPACKNHQFGCRAFRNAFTVNQVMDAEQERLIAEIEHRRTAISYATEQERVNQEYKNHKRSVNRSKTYYEMKASFHQSLDNQKNSIDRLQHDVDSSKKLYSKALENLERISEEIHAARQESSSRRLLGKRELGVGSESPPPAPFTEHSPELDKQETNNNHEIESQPARPVSLPTSDDLDSPQETLAGNLSAAFSTITLPTVIVACDDEEEKTILPLEESKDRSCSLADSITSDTLSSSTSTSPVVMRHRRTLSAIQLSAKRLLDEQYDSAGDDNSVNSATVLDDNSIETALSGKFFNGNLGAEISIVSTKLADEDTYDTLPESLQEFQIPYERTRNSFNADMKLDQVLKLLDEVDDESYV